MPAAPRPSKKAQKIFEEIMGKPTNALDDASEAQKELRKRLDYQDTYIAR